MSFLAPLFFAGLAALAVPVLIHLIQRERKNVVLFPSLMFVRRIPYSSIRRRRIHNWALLAVRLAALALIIAAFARPFLRSATLSAATTGARDLIVLLDRSYSMGHGDQWERAKRAAADAVNTLGNGDRATLVTFSSGAEVAVQGTDDKARLQSEITAMTLSAGATKYGPSLKLAGSLLAASNLPRREVVLISDFQRSAWTPGDGLRLPAGTELKPVAVQADNARNLAVTPVTVQREQVSGQDRVIVTGGVLNRSSDAVPDVPVALEIDGHVVQTLRVSLDPNGSAAATFPPITVTQGNTRGTVRIGEDALARDNAFHFVLSPPRPLPVAVVNGTRGARDQALYLSRALAIGESPRFDAATVGLEDLTDQVLSRTRVVILNDTSPSESLVTRLKRYVENGGGLVVAFGSQAAWPSSAADLLPATPAGSVDRSRGGAGSLGGLEYGHAVFEPFRTPRSGDFSAARFYGYRSVTPSPEGHVLARFDDGTPAVMEKSLGRGRVVLWTSTLDLFWNDLALKPVYLPFVHQLTRYAAAYRERANWAVVGQVIDLSEDGDPSQSRVAVAPGGARLPLEGDQGRVLELTEQGFYEVRASGRQSQLFTVAASNVELGESDRTAVDPAEMVLAVAGGSSSVNGTAGASAIPEEAQERSQRIWWYLLFAGILLLTGESLLAHKLSRAS
ncbi:MAG TPA: BatA domain-containing protein [Vicinamibacterales bacterium]|nr:BatA domain-containing protein [Vicinamibacterales bacterium]